SLVPRGGRPSCSRSTSTHSGSRDTAYVTTVCWWGSTWSRNKGRRRPGPEVREFPPLPLPFSSFSSSRLQPFGEGSCAREPSKTRQGSWLVGSRQHSGFCGISSVVADEDEEGRGGVEVYFLGIIDVLTLYNLKKKSEHTFKSIFHDSVSFEGG